jgi:2-dehydro-3-deoxy-D-gluconate 5-dehydrogenase
MSILDEFNLTGRVALVTGAGRGLGQAMAYALAEAGADIAGVYHSHFEETQAHVTALGRRFLPLACDLQSATVSELTGVVDHVVREWGRLDILVNNAGIIHRMPALEYREEDWDDVIQVDLKAVFFLSQAAARVMIPQGGGKIIQVASLLSFQGGILCPAYTAAKSGMAGLTRALANEWGPKGVNVNAIAPGYMATDLAAAHLANPERYQAILARIPAGRWGEPEDVKGAVLFLASNASNYLHGAVLPVDGGWLAR